MIIPGVGAIGDCMKAIKNLGMDDLIRRFSEEKPILGVCVGMQILLKESEESGGTNCLGLVDGILKKLNVSEDIKVPHMGWNIVNQSISHPMFEGISQNSFFYFVHSYAALDSKNKVSTTDHGQEFISSVYKDNIFAVQFHPEKSQDDGLKIYKNFASWQGGHSK
tara:strand:- start:74 stop:568 length:495 start_codon:yes stop_codon:yes gene_type:complete